MSGMLDPRISILGNSSIGLFGFSTNTYTLLPNGIKKTTLEIIEEHLKTKIIISSLSNTHLNGLFAIGNSNHLLLPDLLTEDEYNSISHQIPSDITIHVLDSKITALGNTIVSSDKVALVHSDYSKSDKKNISDMLDVEVQSIKFLNSSLLGSMIFLSANGFLTHPLFEEDEIKWLSEYFGVHGDVVTVNRGTPYPRLGIIANKYGTIVGSDTTGPEILRITEILQN